MMQMKQHLSFPLNKVETMPFNANHKHNNININYNQSYYSDIFVKCSSMCTLIVYNVEILITVINLCI